LDRFSVQRRFVRGVAYEERECQLERRALAEAIAESADTAPVLEGDGVDEEEAEAGAFDLDVVVGGGAVEALEDALELAGKEAEAGIGDGEDGPGVALDGEAAGDGYAVGRVLHGVIEKVEDGGAEVFDVGEDEEANAAGDVLEGDCLGLEVVAEEDGGDAFGDQGMELDAGALLDALALAELAGLEDGFDGGEEAVAVFAHDGVEALALLLVAGMALQGVEVEADAGDGGLELVGDGLEEGVLALVAADFADQEDGVNDDPGDEDGEEDDAKEINSKAAAVVMDPGDVEDDGEGGETHAQRDEKCPGAAAAVEIH
jgi:hypothetical protein